MGLWALVWFSGLFLGFAVGVLQCLLVVQATEFLKDCYSFSCIY